MSENTAAIGHWFIHEAHVLLRKYRRTDNREVRIIRKLIKAAFETNVEHDYVRKTLERQKKKGEGRKLAEQMQIAISLAEHYFDGGPITVTLRPLRPTKSRALSAKASK